MQTSQNEIQIGFIQFLNILLFDESETPELLSNNYYQLGNLSRNTGLENQKINDNKNGMRHFENSVSCMMLGEFNDTKRNILRSYLNSPAKEIIAEMMDDQKPSYISQPTTYVLNDRNLEFAFFKSSIVPLQMKVFLSNHFADIFDHLYILDGTISEICYKNLLEKYAQLKTLSEININKHVGIHNQVTIPI